MNSLDGLDHEDLENFFLLNGSTDVWFNLVDPVRDQNPDSGCPQGRCCPETGNRMKKVTCGHPIGPIPAPVSGKGIRKTTQFRFPDGHKVASQ